MTTENMTSTQTSATTMEASTPNKQSTLLASLEIVFHQVRRNFQDKADNSEQWQMPPKDYDGNQVLRDDCDGFCLACRVLLRKQSIANRLVYCEVNGAGHLVVEVEGWILDNTQKTVVPNTLLRHYQWRRISGYEAGDPWREVITS